MIRIILVKVLNTELKNLLAEWYCPILIQIRDLHMKMRNKQKSKVHWIIHLANSINR